MIKYRTEYENIEAVDVIRETEHQVVLLFGDRGRERRENKRSDRYNWFDTWEEAHAFLVSLVECEVGRMRSRLEYAENKLDKINGMRPNDKLEEQA